MFEAFFRNRGYLLAANLASVKKNLGSEGSQYQNWPYGPLQSLVNESSHGERKQG